jgi:hypothetical protein
MPVEAKFQRVAPDSPLRCRSAGGEGQCHFQRTENSEYCPMHGGNKGEEKAEKDRIRTYRLSKWRTRLDEFADDPKVKGLREEIGILRILLEETMNRCSDESDLILQSNRISDLIGRIEKVVSSCHRLEQSTGQLLDKTMALNFATQVVEIIAIYVVDGDIVDKISSEIIQRLAQLTPTGDKDGGNGN